jgi:hypothetical protein
MKGAKKRRGAVRGGISQAKANRSHRPKVLPLEVLLGEAPMTPAAKKAAAAG